MGQSRSTRDANMTRLMLSIGLELAVGDHFY